MAEETEQSTAATWGTWEELLLACAVKRHGFKDWNSVAMEVQTRSSLPQLLISARNCELKFLDLKRRFRSGIADKVDTAVDELKKLRVAELRREVQRYDVSINSLQLKVKRLEEDRESDLNGGETGTGKPDLKTRSENDKQLIAVPGADSDWEDFSVNQSNSAGFKSDTEPDFAGSGRPGRNRRAAEPVGPQSDDGSTDTFVKNPTCNSSEMMKKETKRSGGSSELADSEAQSNDGEVQSSVSLSGRMKRKKLFEISGGSRGNEVRRPAAVKSRRLDEILQMIRAHKHGSLFESRLQSQETVEYKSIVRQHLDLETVQAKVNFGSYSSSNFAFYRDLLLLCNNAVTFFPKSAMESIAAREIRLLVTNEMKSLSVARTGPFHDDMDSSPANPSGSKVPDLERSQSLLAKQKSSVPIIVCRKRSTIPSKPSLSSLGEKGDESNDDEKSAADLKPTIKMASTVVEDHDTIKDSSKVKEKPITGARSMRRSSDSATNSSDPSIKKQTSNNSGWKPSSVIETEIPKPDKKKLETVALEKKRSAADFLKRIKQNSPAETKKRNSKGGSSSTGNAAATIGEQKKGSGKGNTANERVSSIRQSNDKKLPKEEASPSKRSVGRPPKKAAEAEPAPATAAAPTKRSREGGGKEPLKRARKRARR